MIGLVDKRNSIHAVNQVRFTTSQDAAFCVFVNSETNANESMCGFAQ